MDGAGSWQAMRADAARRDRARRRRREAGRASTDWPDFAPQTGLGDGPLGAAQAADRQIARLYAQRPAPWRSSPPPGRPRPTGRRVSPVR